MKKQKIRIMILLFLLFAVMLFVLSFTNFNYSKKAREEHMDMELEQLMFPGCRNGHEALPSRFFPMSSWKLERIMKSPVSEVLLPGTILPLTQLLKKLQESLQKNQAWKLLL